MSVKIPKGFVRAPAGHVLRKGVDIIHGAIGYCYYGKTKKRTWIHDLNGNVCDAVELKTKNGKLSRDQIDCLNSLHVAFAMCAVVRSYADFCGLLDGSMKCRYMGEA